MSERWRLLRATAWGAAIILLIFGPVSGRADASGAPLSEATQACLDCHEALHPGLVADWKASRHARVSPGEAVAGPPLERRVSAATIPDSLQSTAVGCYECHSLNGSAHADNFEHFEFRINVVVSPNDCSTCHSTEADQYASSKKAHALGILQKNPVYHGLVSTITGLREADGVKVVHLGSSENAKKETCYACHGTEVTVEGMKTIEVEGEEVEVPVLTNWPNQGVGRVNPDGSRGACTACHPRHSFSIEIARKPHTCSQCHLQPDVPAWDVYRESKHGNITMSLGDAWDWDHVPWRVGLDFRAPSCATCHSSLVVSPDGDVISDRTHDFGARLWVRIFGLLYSHPQPKDGRTFQIENADGLPLPTTFAGQPASPYLIEPEEQGRRRATMGKVCRSCHSTDWIEGHFAKLDSTLIETDKMVLAATQLIVEAWDRDIEDRTNPFDEPLEQKWIAQWLFYANSVRYGSAMGGPDYAAFKNGWWNLTRNLGELEDSLNLKAAAHK